MKKKRLIVFTLGSAAALAIVGLAVLFIPRIRYQLQESELIEIIQAEAPPGRPEAREAAARKLGEMRSVRAIPYIIQLWDQPSMKDVPVDRGRRRSLDRQVRQEHIAGCEALALIGEPAIPFLGEVLRGGEMEARPGARPRLSEKGSRAVVTCKEMGPAALPLLPEILEWYRRRPSQEVVDAIMAIGEPESMKEVAPWITKKAAREAELLQRMKQARLELEQGGNKPSSSSTEPWLQVPVPAPVSEDDPNYHLRESELIEAIKIKGPAREAAVRELGAMRSVRAIPHIIRIWDEPLRTREQRADGTVVHRTDKVVRKEHVAACEALALIGEPAVPLVGEVFRSEMKNPTNMDKRLMAVFTCKEMGPVALPLLPEFLKWYRSGRANRDYAVYVIRAIGEPESVKEVAGWTREPMAGWGPGETPASPVRGRLRSQRGSTDGLPAEKEKGDGPDKRDDWPMLPLR